MKITFLGAAKTVTGSCYLIETQVASFLIDCGMFQGRSAETQANSTPFAFDTRKIDFMLLSHSHIDHSGRIPKLYKDGYRNKIYATKATKDLCGIMLPDAAHIQESEHAWKNRRNERSGKPQIPPLYTIEDATNALQLFIGERYDIPFSPVPSIKVIFRDAGHILGSSIIELYITEDGKEKKVVFSGDLGNTDIPIMRDPTIIEGADILVMESTYGDREHDNSRDKLELLVDTVNETIRGGGNVVIPSFAVGRTQELIYEINKEIARLGEKSKVFLETPVVVDSPLAISATEIFRANEDCFDEEAQEYIRNKDNPLDFPNLSFARTADESKALNEDKESKIIISSSGMCDAGRIKHHLKHNLWRADSTILFVGYQAPGTLGRQILDGSKKVRLFGEEVQVKARIASILGYSGHADREGLINWVSAMTKKPEQIILVHGEPETMISFSKDLEATFGLQTQIPGFGESIDTGALLPAATPLKVVPVSRPTGIYVSLDGLQEQFNGWLEDLKLAITKADTLEERTELITKALKVDAVLSGLLQENAVHTN